MRFGICSSALALVLSACIIAPPGFGDNDPWGDDDPTTDSDDRGPFGSSLVEFAWQVGAAGCIDAGVETIEVTMGSVSDVFDCLEGRGSIEVRTGTYDLLLEGLDSKGFARYEGGVADVVVGDGATVPLGTIRLQARTGDLEATWRFEDGRLCGPNGVVELDLALIQNERIIEQVITDCADGIELLPGVVAGEYELQALGNDLDGFVTHRAVETVIVDQGELATTELVLVAD